MFRVEKATAMAVHFLEMAHCHKLNDLVLMKLMVIAERKCMEETTSLISGSRFVSMQHGPVLSDIFDVMKGIRSSDFWNHSIRFVPHNESKGSSNHCVLVNDLDTTEYLSGFEIDLITSVWKTHSDKDKWDLVDLTHTFPEWDATCAKSKSSAPIPMASIFRLGFHNSPEMAIERAQEIEYFETVV